MAPLSKQNVEETLLVTTAHIWIVLHSAGYTVLLKCTARCRQQSYVCLVLVCLLSPLSGSRITCCCVTLLPTHRPPLRILPLVGLRTGSVCFGMHPTALTLRPGRGGLSVPSRYISPSALSGTYYSLVFVVLTSDISWPVFKDQIR